MKMRLEQDQIWKKDDKYYKILVWEQRAIEYKVFTDLETKEGEVHNVTKKEFCRLISEGELIHYNQK